MVHIKFDQDRPASFRNILLWNCGRTTTDDDDGRRTTDDDGRRMPAYPISSPVSLRLRWAKNWFFKHSRAANSAVQGQIWLKFELIQDVMVILVSSKHEEDPIKIEGHNTKYWFFKHSRAANSAVKGWIWPKFELIRDIVVILVTCKNEEDWKTKMLELPQHKILIFQTLKGR